METTSIAPAPTVTAPELSTSGSSALITSDFEVFLTMLTAQAKYQDPLEPIDSSEYAAQLAQFSMVEQQVETNTLMEQLVTALSTSDAGNLANWIGMDALTTGPAHFDGTPITIVPDPPAGAEEMYLVVTDESGFLVETKQLNVSSDPIEWTGLRADGTGYLHGNYNFEIETRIDDEVQSISNAQVFGRVTESRLQDGIMRVILASGHSVATGNVLGLRAPQGG